MNSYYCILFSLESHLYISEINMLIHFTVENGKCWLEKQFSGITCTDFNLCIIRTVNRNMFVISYICLTVTQNQNHCLYQNGTISTELTFNNKMKKCLLSNNKFTEMQHFKANFNHN